MILQQSYIHTDVTAQSYMNKLLGLENMVVCRVKCNDNTVWYIKYACFLSFLAQIAVIVKKNDIFLFKLLIYHAMHGKSGMLPVAAYNMLSLTHFKIISSQFLYYYTNIIVHT